MKSKILALVISVSLVFFTNCNNDDDNISCDEYPISGVWNLRNVTGGLVGVNIDYNDGDVILNFNPTNGTLVVENNILTDGPESMFAGFESGTYTYSILQEGTNETLLINDMQMGVVQIEDNVLTIDDGIAADGFIRTFVR